MLGDGQANHGPGFLGVGEGISNFDGAGRGEAEFGCVELADAFGFGFVRVNGEQIGIVKVQFYHHH